MAATVAAKNRKVRQDALREMLSKKCTVEQVLNNVMKMETQGASMEGQELTALKYATDARLKLINKYLPELKASELSMIDEDGKTTGFKVTFSDGQRDNDTTKV